MSGVTIGPGLSQYVAKRAAVIAAVRAKAEEVAAKAEGLLAAHRKDGTAKIEVTSGRVDSYVCLVDPNALSIEYGHREFTRASDGQHVGASQGLHILAKAAES